MLAFQSSLMSNMNTFKVQFNFFYKITNFIANRFISIKKKNSNPKIKIRI